VLITCSYREKEFVRVGYYVSNEYEDEMLRENPPEEVDFNLLQRNILADQPRVTRFPIPWDGDEDLPPVESSTMNEEPEEMEINDNEEEEEDDEEEEESDDDENAEVDLEDSDDEECDVSDKQLDEKSDSSLQKNKENDTNIMQVY
jgi:histone chaperone ASF1